MHALSFWGRERGKELGQECPTCDKKFITSKEAGLKTKNLTIEKKSINSFKTLWA